MAAVVGEAIRLCREEKMWGKRGTGTILGGWCVCGGGWGGDIPECVRFLSRQTLSNEQAKGRNQGAQRFPCRDLIDTAGLATENFVLSFVLSFGQESCSMGATLNL